MNAMDGVELAVLSNRFEGAVLSMMNTLLRTSRSGVINNGRDFSCCILTAGDELLAMAESQPIHVLAGPDLMARTMKEFHPALARGQAFTGTSTEWSAACEEGYRDIDDAIRMCRSGGGTTRWWAGGHASAAGCGRARRARDRPAGVRRRHVANSVPGWEPARRPRPGGLTSRRPTVVIDPGATARRTESGSLVINPT